MASQTTLDEPSLLDKLSNVATPSLAKLDAFPKLPATYKARSESRGVMTIFVALFAVVLLLNDVSEFLWGWPDYEFSVDRNVNPNLEINLDMVIAMPCSFISVDLRDAVGDRLFLSGSLRQEGTLFDVGQATELTEHSKALSVSQAVSQSRKSRGLFAWLFWKKPTFMPRYNYHSDGNACRITGSLTVKRVTANLHVTTIGHGYASYDHVDHRKMNLSHIITEFSFGPFFPEIVQPLDNSYESTDKHFVAYQYYLHVVPTTYIAPRSSPLHTAQYSVTHYTREVSHDAGTPGIFFKFDIDPLAISIHQRTTTFLQLLIRCVGVLGGVFVCMGYAIRVTTKAVAVVTGNADANDSIVSAETTAVRIGFRGKWGGGEIRSRAKSPKVIPQGSGWTVDGGPSSSPYASYAGTPASSTYSPSLGVGAHSPYLSPNAASLPYPYSPNPGTPAFRSTSPSAPPRSAMAPTFTPRSASGGMTTFPASPLAVPTTFPGSPLPTGTIPVNPLDDETSTATNGHGQEHLTGPTTPGVGYATFLPPSPQPTRLAPPHARGGARKED